MGVHGFCPRCGNQISHEQMRGGVVHCSCGWHDTKSAVENETVIERKTIGLMVGAFIAVAAVLGQFVNYGEYAFSVPAARVQKSIGLLSADGHRELARACIELNKWSCAKDAYADLFASKRDVRALGELAILQMKLGETKDAVKTFAAYVKAGGKNGDTLVQYGRTLESVNRFDEALKIYQASIEARPQTLPVVSMSGIVRILMKRGQYTEARRRIIGFHKSAGNAKGYLNTELAQLNNRLEAQGNRSIASVPGRG